MQIIPATALALFCTLAHFVFLNLRAIRLSVEKQLTNYNPVNTRLELQFLQRQHLSLCKSIYQLNRCFGIYLVMEVTFIFVGVINSSMFVLMGAIGTERLLGAVNGAAFIDQAIHLFLITSFSDQISKEVNLIYERLAELVFFQPTLQNEVVSLYSSKYWWSNWNYFFNFLQVCLFSEQLLNVRSYIDAMGFFRVNKQLFPSVLDPFKNWFFHFKIIYSSFHFQLIGTNLTYFLILLQFHSAEKEWWPPH